MESSIGHIRDLPSNAAEIPETYKGESWARLGVNVDEGFVPLYIIPSDKKTQVRKLKSHLKNAQALYLATDEDREGEAIAWHLAEVLNPKCPVRRMVFDEITKQAIANAVDNTREINDKLVSAQETRRILDRLFGYEVSPVLWRKVGPKLSAGRVQSVATRLVVDREWLRMKFREAEYWDLEAALETKEEKKEGFTAKLVDLGGKRIAVGKDFDNETGALREGRDVKLLTGDVAQSISEEIKQNTFTVSEVTQKPFTNRPYPPFITSTLQQEAARKLRFGAQRTMRVAQNLYENGFITYMRTDSTNLSSQALEAARNQVRTLYGDEFLPPEPRVYKKKSKNAQEAHEAIRPAGDECRTPKSLASELDDDAYRLYELIWKRTVASQMKDATGMRTSVRIEVATSAHGPAGFSASGKVIQFSGFLRAYVEGSDDPEAELEDQEKILPPLTEGQALDARTVEALQHLTQPPSRYTEASLIKELEERGIGRPSTYASIIQTIQDRGYVWRKGTALVPTFTAFAVVNLLTRHLPSLVDYDFTARMEDDLDAIANGDCASEPWLTSFYFGVNGKSNGNGTRVESVGLREMVSSSGEEIDARAVSSILIGKTQKDEDVVVRVGRYGPYIQIGDREERASVPDDTAPDSLTVDRALELIEQASQGDRVIGEHPETKQPIYIKTGRFGPYVQQGDPELTPKGKVKRGTAPRRASLWPSMTMEDISLDEALLLLSFPKELGEFPDTKEPILVQDGRFGPYIKSGSETRSLPDHETMRKLTLEDAIALLKQPKQRGRASTQLLADLGKRPETEDAIQIKKGRYGPYVTDGVVNATIPKGTEPTTVSLERALELLEAREQKLKDQGKDPRAKSSKKKKKSTKKKAKAAKKTTAKKKTTKKSTTKKSTAKKTVSKKKSVKKSAGASDAAADESTMVEASTD